MKNHKCTLLILPLLFGTLFSACNKKEIITPKAKLEIPRDEAALQLHYPALKEALANKDISIHHTEIFLRAFKLEEKLEVWVKEKDKESFLFFKEYDFCANSGKPGPKRIEGDRQIPEGPYHISVYNPMSDFHLSLGLNYPNESDKILGHPEKPGNHIYIHGGCMTIGCIPITNPNIKELYALASISHLKGQEQIPVHILPFKMNQDNLRKWSGKYPQHQEFWKNIQAFYSQFEQSRNLIKFETKTDGSFVITS